ncbi:MAG: hypothetical protein MPL62_04215, partial [Alphaproteobacteria bacterium]|nr:hypothetical protein [Alphaproteobacteria bacterium]
MNPDASVQTYWWESAYSVIAASRDGSYRVSNVTGLRILNARLGFTAKTELDAARPTIMLHIIRTSWSGSNGRSSPCRRHP